MEDLSYPAAELRTFSAYGVECLEEFGKREIVSGQMRPCLEAAAKSLQSCPTLCNSMDGSLPGSPVPGILQARTLEWVAISFSRN